MAVQIYFILLFQAPQKKKKRLPKGVMGTKRGIGDYQLYLPNNHTYRSMAAF